MFTENILRKENNVIYDNVKKICKAKGISVGKMEQELGFSNGSISKWNESDPGAHKVQKVAKYLKVSIEKLME